MTTCHPNTFLATPIRRTWPADNLSRLCRDARSTLDCMDYRSALCSVAAQWASRGERVTVWRGGTESSVNTYTASENGYCNIYCPGVYGVIRYSKEKSSILYICSVPSTHNSYQPSPRHSFIPGLKPFFSVNPSHRVLPFFLQGWLHGLPRTVYRYFWVCPFFTFYFSCFPFFFSFWFRAVD